MFFSYQGWPTGMVAAAVITCSAGLAAQGSPLPLVGKVVPFVYKVETPGNERNSPVLAAEKLIRFPGATFLQIGFESIRLGEGSILEVLSLTDDERQVWKPETLAEQGRSALQSCYFNGDAVLVRLWAGTRSRGDAVAIKDVAVGAQRRSSRPASLCGADNRLRFNDPRIARILVKVGFQVGVCTAWLISPVNCFATAGHCLSSSPSSVVAQFNVPDSLSTGFFVNPPLKDQYSWQGAVNSSFENGGIGKDWGVFTTNRNSVTGRHAGSLQKRYFLFQGIPGVNTSLTIRGHGSDSTPLKFNFVQQTASGPLRSVGTTSIRHRVDTQGGNSGSPIFVSSTGKAIGVHTHGGCTATGGSNAGTRADYRAFAAARARHCVLRPRPDFHPIDVKASVTVLQAGGFATLSARIANIGTATAPVATHGIYVSTNRTISRTDTLVYSFATPALSIGASILAAGNVRLPTNLASGSCFLGVLADRLSKVTEELETNNTIAKAVTCRGLPDLAVPAMTPSTTVLTPAKSFSIRATIANIGKEASVRCSSGCYLSVDRVITTRDTLLLGFSTPSLAANTSRTVTLQMRAPVNLQSGVCFLGTFADRLFQVLEISEKNNTHSVQVTCSNPVRRPDLVVSSFSASTSVWSPGGLVSGSLSVKNLGTISAAASVTGIFLSKDAVITAADTLLGSQATAALSPGRAVTLRYSVRIPAGARPGACFLGGLADRTNAVTESNELNNYKAVAGRCLGKADLVVSAVSAAGTAAAGGFVSVTSSTKNAGSATAASSFTAVYLSADSSITTADTYLGGYSTGILLPGTAKTLTTRHLVPYCTQGGRYFFGAVADQAGDISEISETNNARSTAAATTLSGYGGGRRILEFSPSWSGPARSTGFASFSARIGGKVRMCVTAPGNRGAWFLLLWSGSGAGFNLDSLTSFELGLLNTPMFAGWFGRTDAASGQAFPSFLLPQTVLRSGFDVYTYHLWFDPGLTRVLGFGSNRLRTRIAP